MRPRKTSKRTVEPEPPAELLGQFPFGPAFFLSQLRAFARDRCPDPSEGLPVVQLHLVDGEVLDLCHILAVAPAWVALAVNETERSSLAPRMRTEVVPYAGIVRTTIRAVRSETPHHGFDPSRTPGVIPGVTAAEPSPEAAFRAATAERGLQDERTPEP